MKNEKVGEINGNFAKLIKLGSVLGPIATTIVIAALGWISTELRGSNKRLEDIQTQISDVRVKMAVVEGNRFSSADGLKVWEAIGSIRTDLAKVPSEIPPKWFIERVDRIEANVDKLAQQTLQLSHIVSEMHKGDSPKPQ